MQQGEVFHYRFKSSNGRWLTVTALIILGIPVLLWILAHLGGCVVSSTDSYCRYLPDMFAHFLFGLYVFAVFGAAFYGWWLIFAPAVIAILMLVLAVFLEFAAQQKSD